MAESKRDAAVRLFLDFMDNDRRDPTDSGPRDRDAAGVIDAIIEAARAPESKHARDLTAAQRKALNDPRV